MRKSVERDVKHHFKDETEMEKRLNSEKIIVKNDKIIDFKSVFWDPSKELEL